MTGDRTAAIKAGSAAARAAESVSGEAEGRGNGYGSGNSRGDSRGAEAVPPDADGALGASVPIVPRAAGWRDASLAIGHGKGPERQNCAVTGEPLPDPAGAGLPRALSLNGSLAPEDAAARIAAFAGSLDPALVLLFASPAERLADLAPRLRAALPGDCRLAGCSSAGELCAGGYGHDGIVAIAFPATGYAVETVRLDGLARAGVTRWMADLRAARRRLEQQGRAHLLGLVVADGISRHEDVLAAAIDAALPGVPTIGGFAGNGLAFADVRIMEDGCAFTDSAMLCLLATNLPVEELVFAHFAPTGRRCVVTAADPATHTIRELNAEPAAAEYARLAGLDPARLGPVEFAQNPLLLRMGRHHHVRAISGVREDGGLQLLASIDTGTVLTLGRAEELVQGFAEALARLPRKPALVLGFDCILRRLALEQAGLQNDIARLHARYNICGFNTYGELHEGMHVNQTFVGMAFLPPEGEHPGDDKGSPDGSCAATGHPQGVAGA